MKGNLMRPFLITTLLSLLLSTSVGAQSRSVPCGDRNDLVKTLQEKYSENVVVRALVGGNQMMEILASPGGSYTVMMTKPDGTSCLVSNGENLRILEPNRLKGPEL
jgi:hypothetical protein